MFEECAVAFLDILGFKNLIFEAEKNSSVLPKLLALKAVLDGHVKFDNAKLDSSVPTAVHPKYIFISDSIIFSVPLKHEKFDGLDIVVSKSIQVAQKVLELGFLIRGGISVGPVWHEQTSDRSNIFGSGYIDAYLTETVANHPHILLSKAATAIWKESGRATPELCIGSEALAVDILHPWYIPSADDLPFEDYFLALRAHIESSLKNLPLGGEPRAKWEWMAGFFNEALSRHQISTEPFTSLPLPA